MKTRCAGETFRRRSLLIERLEDRHLLSGVTLITHGHWGNVAPDGWIDHMSAAIAEAALARGTVDLAQYTMVIDEGGGGAIVAHPPVRDTGPASWEEAIIRVDWSDLSVGTSSSTPTGDVADAIADYLTTSAVDGRWLFESPVQLIGHSRGASLNTVLAERLGELGIWVDHFTSLDPHPVDGIGGDDLVDYGDAPMAIWENVRFADTYWREDWNVFDFDGEAVPGAFNLELNEDVLGQDGYSIEHSDVHLWYHGTIDTTGDLYDGDVGTPVPETAGWYDGAMGPRDQTGFHYGRIRGGDRPSSGLAAAGAHREGVSLSTSGANVWDNVEILDLWDHSSVAEGLSVDLLLGFEDLNEDATVTAGYDTDANPYNGVSTVNQQSQSTASYDETMPFTLSTIALSGDYRVYAQISNGTRTRYYYAPETVSIPVEVVDLHVFYNDSAWDDLDRNRHDDDAIAPDKEALLPGETATFANYTSYVRGVNGVMIDINGLPDDATLDGNDFQFRLGNSSDPGSWANLPVADGEDAANVWDDSYRGVWHLCETRSTDPENYKDSTPNANHGQLVDADGDTAWADGKVFGGVHFAGDADYIDVGNDATLDITGTVDVDSVVVTNTLSRYEAWPSLAKDSSDNIYMTYRTTDDNAHGYSATGKTVIRKSTDNGATWSAEVTVSDIADLDDKGGGVLVFDDDGTETILVVYRTKSETSEDRAYCRESTDGGATFSDPTAISPGLQRRAKGEPIQLSNGKIIAPMYALGGNSYMVESSDGGDTWTEYTVTTATGDETSFVELKTDGEFAGKLYAVTRDNLNKRFYKTLSYDYGHSWGPSEVATEFPLISGVYSATFLNLFRMSNDTILAAYTRDWPRHESAIYQSTDEAANWDQGTVILGSGSHSFYPSLLEIDPAHLGVAWCTNDYWNSDIFFANLDYPLNPFVTQDILTLEAWFERDDIDHHDGIVARDARIGDSYSLRIRGYGIGSPQFGAGGASFSGVGRKANDTDWHHVAVTMTDRTAYIYIDGAQNESGLTGSLLSSDNATLIGAMYAAAGMENHFEGVIDEVRISAAARSPEWIAFQYANIDETDHELAWASETVDLTHQSYYKTITIQDDHLDAEVENFPLYVNIDADTDIGARARVDGHDVRFTLDDGVTKLKYEREYWNVSDGAARGQFWVKVPSILASGGATIRCYYGRTSPADTITLRRHEGTSGSDRVTITFDDNSIENQWLQVTVLANENTELAEDDVFYFGNAIGEAGNSADRAKVDAYDVLRTRNHPRPFFDPAAIDTNHDFNRDERVDAVDTLIARNHLTWSMTELQLIDLSGGKQVGADAASMESTLARDVLFEQEEAFRVKSAWLAEFERFTSPQRSFSGNGAAEKAVQKLLLTDWL